MTHALRQNCGSFLYDSIRREWGVGSEPVNKANLKETCGYPTTRNMDQRRAIPAAITRDMDQRGAIPEAIPGQEVVKVKCAPKEWPLFGAPGLSSMRVTSYKEKRGTLYFTVLAVLEGFKWRIDRTYEEFMELHRTLTRTYGMNYPPLPNFKKLFGIFGKVKVSQLEEMKNNLEDFTMTAVTSFPIPPTELLKFVEYPFTDVLSITQSLAKFFYVEGEMVLANNKAIQMSPLQLHCINKRMTLPLASSESGNMKDDFGHFLDFLQNLRKLKIAPPTEEHASIANLDTMTFELNLMKSLEVLLIESINIQQLEARFSLPKQLVKLEVRRSLKLLQDILLIYPSSDVDYSPAMPGPFSPSLAADLSKAMVWEKLQQANFKLNGIKKLDQSVKLLSSLERLDLSYNYIEEVEHLVELPHLRVLDLSHNKITRLIDLHTKLGNITKLGLACNNIVKLNGIQKMFSLQYLDLSNNQISDVSEVRYLDPLPCLENLFLKGNPIFSSLSYRAQVFSNLPHFAEQVALDGKKPSKDELVVSSNTPTTGHKRVPSRTPDIRPDEVEEKKTEVPEDMEVGLSMTNRLEELRKAGGDTWLSILNAEQKKMQDEDVVVAKSPKNPRKKKKQAHHHKAKSKKSPEMATFEVAEPTYSHHLTELMKATQEEKLPNTVNFQVTVLEYRNSSFLSLSLDDLDQILMNTPMEECALSIDTLIAKALEIDLAVDAIRVTRDLGIIHHMKVHEGKRLAVCLQLPSSRSSGHGGSKWIIYCVQKLNDLARLHHVLNTAIIKSRLDTPNKPLLDILNSIKSDVDSPNPHSSLFKPDFQLTDSINHERIVVNGDSDKAYPAMEECYTACTDRNGIGLYVGTARDLSGSVEEKVESETSNKITSISVDSLGAQASSLSLADDGMSGTSVSSLVQKPSELSSGAESDFLSPTGEISKVLALISKSASPSEVLSLTNEEVNDINKISSSASPVNSSSSPGLSSKFLSPDHGHISDSSPSTPGNKSKDIKDSKSGNLQGISPIEKSKSPSHLKEKSKPSSSNISPAEKSKSPSHLKEKSQDSKPSSSNISPAEKSKSPLHLKEKSQDSKPSSSNISPAEKSKSPHLREKSQDSKPSSNTSSRAGSGRSTPKVHKQMLSSLHPTKGALLKNSRSPSPGDQNTPPLSKPNKPPSNLNSEYITAKLKSLISDSDLPLPSPLYSQDEDKSLEQGIKGDSSGDVDEDSAVNSNSMYERVDENQTQTDRDLIEVAVALSSSELADSHVHKSRERTKSGPRKIIAKPGLESNDLRKFFKNVIADESSEILMNVTWGACNLPSVPSCEIEVGTLISDKGIYLLEVLDPDKHRARILSWENENLPLAKITCCYHTNLRKVTIGIFDQSLLVESFEKSLVKCFVFFPHTYEKLNMFMENLKAAFDANNLSYTIVSTENPFLGSSDKGMVIQNPDSEDMAKLKDSLVWSKCRAQVGNFLAVNSKSNANPITIPFDSELKKVSMDVMAKFEIVQYVIVGEISTDTLPVSNGKIHIRSRALILTNKTIYLCKEDLDSWLHRSTSIRSPPFPRCTVIDAHPISRISAIKMCDKSHPVISVTDALYEFSILFEELDDIQLSPTLSKEWVLCVHDRQYLDQFLSCLTHLCNEQQKEKQKLITIKHTSSQLMTPVLAKPPKLHQPNLRRGTVSKKTTYSNRGTNPCFFSSKVLFEFSILTNYQRRKFFKENVAQAEFLKSDEVPLSVFLAHCSFSSPDYTEIETCVIASNYALYLLSDVENIQQWMDAGGATSFQRRDLLDRKVSGQIRCFYRLWLNEIKQVNVGVFYSCVSITDTKESDSFPFTIHTENRLATVSFLSSLAYVVHLHDADEEKEMDNLLSDYDFVVDSTTSEQKKPVNEKQHNVEFVYHSDDSLEKLKKAMVNIIPASTKGISAHANTQTLKILYQQVVLLVEELRIPDLLTSRFNPHIVFLTNQGVYVCVNKTSEQCSPSVMDPSKLTVKKWCHVDLLDRLHVTSPHASQYSCYNVTIYIRTLSRVSSLGDSSNSLSLLMQNSDLLDCFLYHFALMYSERCGKQISITRD